MATELTMPQMGYDMQEGKLIRWLKAEGSEVEVGEAVAEIETDKAVVEFESYASGILRRILVLEGATVPVGQPIAIVGAEGEVLPDPIVEAPSPSVETISDQPEPSSPQTPIPQDLVPVEPDLAVRASPVARRIADEWGIDISQVEGTGPGGRITRDDVLAFEPETDAVAAESQASPDPDIAPLPATAEIGGETVPLNRMRQQIARVTVASKREKPHFYVTSEVEMTQAMQLRQQVNDSLRSQHLRVSVNDLIIKACVQALIEYPRFNAFFVGDGIQMNDGINIGIAIAEKEGLIVPAIMDCADMSLKDVAVAVRDLAERAKSGALRTEEYAGGTFTVSNLSMFDITGLVAIIPPPQTAVLGVGAVTKKPIVREDEIVIGQMMTVTLSSDHRVVDGADSARFLSDLKRMLENPLSLLL